jgi:hypothetical protein
MAPEAYKKSASQKERANSPDLYEYLCLGKSWEEEGVIAKI